VQITLRGKNIDLTDALRDYVEKKLGKFDKYFQQPLVAQVTLSVERDRHIVEITIPVNDIVLRGEEATGDMYSSIDLVVEKIERQVHKYKTRINRKLRETGGKGLGELILEAASNNNNEAEDQRVVKTKRFPLKPMIVDEAIMQMNLVGHDFFVFANADTDEINVVYRRKDGDYGLLEPNT